MPLKIGSLLDSRYRVVAYIGHGGMAEVYEANDIITKKTMAIKLIRDEVMKNPVNLKRFQNEATIAASLNHPNIVKVYNHGTIEGRPYIANEYIKGQNLKDILDIRSTLSLNEAVDYMIQLTSALSYAHYHGIIHRDVKPQNIFVMSDGSIKLGDFGIAQVEGETNGLTKTSEIVGSVHYLAPEICVGKQASNLSDIYAAGVTFFELITGHIPFNKDTMINTAIAHVRDKFPSPKKYLPNCPKDVERIIFKATKRKPNERYQNAEEFNKDLLALKQQPDVLKEKKSFIAKLLGFK